MSIDTQKPTQVLRLKEVLEKTGMARSSLYSAIQKRQFPQSISLGERAVGWLEHEVEEWIQERVKESRRP